MVTSFELNKLSKQQQDLIRTIDTEGKSVGLITELFHIEEEIKAEIDLLLMGEEDKMRERKANEIITASTRLKQIDKIYNNLIQDYRNSQEFIKEIRQKKKEFRELRFKVYTINKKEKITKTEQKFLNNMGI